MCSCSPVTLNQISILATKPFSLTGSKLRHALSERTGLSKLCQISITKKSKNEVPHYRSGRNNLFLLRGLLPSILKSLFSTRQRQVLTQRPNFLSSRQSGNYCREERRLSLLTVSRPSSVQTKLL